MPIAFVDESGRHRRSGSCIYVTAAVIVDEDELIACRLTLESLRHGKSPTVHWRVEQPARRALIASTLADMPIQAVAAATPYTRGTRTERARRQCLSRLLPELGRRQVSAAELETRGSELDRRDRQLLTGLRKSGLIPVQMDVRWGQPSREPMLWAADCVAGSITWWFGGETRYFDQLGDLVKLIEVD